MPMSETKFPSATVGGLCLAFFLLGLYRLQVPNVLVFDEHHYSPAAWKLLHGTVGNREHPMLAKELIAGSIRLLGGGWASARIAGLAVMTLGLAAFAYSHFRLFGSARGVLVFIALVSTNCLYFVTARIAILDPYMVGFAGLSIAAFMGAILAPEVRLARYAVAGVLMGLSLASKWASLPILVLMGLAVAVTYWRNPLRMAIVGSCIAGAAAIVYLLTFAPLLSARADALSIGEIVALQRPMYRALALLISGHPYSSYWWHWPFGGGGMWLFDSARVGRDKIIILGQNPVATVASLTALVMGTVIAVRDKDWRVGAVLLAYVTSLGFWAISGKPVQFVYSYNLPSIFALALAAHLLTMRNNPAYSAGSILIIVASVAFFTWAYPAMTAARITEDQLALYARFPGWERNLDRSLFNRPIGNGRELRKWATHCMKEPLASDCAQARSNPVRYERPTER